MPENDFPSSDDASPKPPLNRSALAKRAGLLLVVLVLIGVAWRFRAVLNPEQWAGQEERLREVLTTHPWSSAGGAFLFYVLVTGLSIPGATMMTLIIGWAFGFWPALVIVSFGSTAGATVAFVICRFLFREWVSRRLGTRGDRIKTAFEREGPYFLFTLRLIPAFPFFLINAVMGLTNIRLVTFWWVSQLGMLPATAVYVYTGSNLPSLEAIGAGELEQILTWQLLLGFALLGLLPWILKQVLRRLGFHSAVAAPPVSLKTNSRTQSGNAK